MRFVFPFTTTGRGRRQRRLGLCRLVAVAFALGMGAHGARAIIVIDGDGRRLTPPTSTALVGSGWQYEGEWGAFLGTAIAPHFFVTAKHVGGTVGEVFRFRNRDYTTVDRFASPTTDLTVWRVEETFTDFVPLCRAAPDGSGEIGRSVVVCGRGTARGSAVRVKGRIAGWYWGPEDHAWSWGADTVVGTADPGAPVTGRDTGRGNASAMRCGRKLLFTFDARDGAENTCMVSGGDSGGGVFARSPGGHGWELVGVVWGFQDDYHLTRNAPDLSAAICDSRGLWTTMDAPGRGSRLAQITGDEPVPGIWFGSRIVANQAFLEHALASGAHSPPETAAFARLLRFARLLFLVALGAGLGVIASRQQRRRPPKTDLA
jgi:hypothetical protein